MNNTEITIVEVTKWSKKPNSTELLLTEIQTLWVDLQKAIDHPNLDEIKANLKITLEESIEFIKEN